MSCVDLPAPPPLPTITAGFSIPSFTPPAIPAVPNICCTINVPVPPLPNIPGLPAIPSSVMATINAGLLTIDAYLDAIDSYHISCPLQ